MKAVMSREYYKFFHSKRQCLILALLIGIAVWMFTASIGWKKEMVYVLLDETEKEREFFLQNGELDQDIFDLIGAGHSDHNAGVENYFWITPEAMELFQEGAPLWEKYHSYHFPERMVLQQMLGGTLTPPEEKDFETRWKFYQMLADPSAAYVTIWIMAAFFFGRDFTIREYQGALFAGQKRKKIFLGKYLFFILLLIFLSLVELVLAMVVFIPDIWLLPVFYIIRGFVLRCLCDIGMAMVCVIFSFLCRSEWKAIGLSFLFMWIFFIWHSSINSNPYQFVTDAYWKTCSDIGISMKIVVVTVVLFLASGFLSAKLFQRTELT